MDSYSDHPSEYDASQPAESSAADEVALAIGSDERRMHVRAYNYWASLLDGRDFPSIEDLEPESITDFSPNSVLLDFTAGRDNPATPYIGTAIRAECGLGDDVGHIDQVPKRSLLSRLTDHYMQIIANRAPIGFEAEFVNQRGHSICYRGILMPFSSDGDTIDFIYGVINWKDSGQSEAVSQPLKAALPPLDPEEEIDEEEEEEAIVETSGPPVAEPTIAAPAFTQPAFAQPAFAPPASSLPDTDEPHLTWEEGPLAEAPEPVVDAEAAIPIEEPQDIAVAVDEPLEIEAAEETDELDELDTGITLDDDAGLADRLWAARETAEICKQQDGRSRAALYRALDMAYDFAVAARRVPEEYAEILDDAGVKSQARAPMTPIVKLVFGIDYDKTRLTEFAAALNYAQRQEVDFGGFQAFLDAQPGGLKALVAAERKARRPETGGEDKAAAARAALRQRGSIALADLPTNEEFALVVTRRNANGIHEVVALVSDEAMLDRAIRRAA